MFYTSPDICVVNILCRIQPGPTLSGILAWLHTNRIHVQFQGHESNALEAVLCTDDILRGCRQGKPFCRAVSVKAYSLDTILNIRLGPFNDRFYNVSSSPYKLGYLVQHQEQGWLLNSQRHKQDSSRTGNSYPAPLQLELDRLIEAIRLTL